MFPHITHHSSINYRDAFRPLIALHQETDILSIIHKELEKMPASSSSAGFFSKMFAASSTARPPVEIEKLFRRKIKDWIELLDDYLETNRYNPVGLPELQEAVRPIYLEGKTQILAEKMKRAGLFTKKTEGVVQKLNKFLLRVLQAPHVSKIAETDSGSLSSLLLSHQPLAMGSIRSIRSFTGLSIGGLLAASSESTPVDPAEVHREMIQRSHQLQIKRRAREVSLFNPKWGDGWEEKIIQAMESVDKEDVLKELGNQLSPIQLIVIFQHLLQKPSENWKLVFLLASLKSDPLIELLPSFTTNQLYLMRAAVTSGAEQNREWFENAVKSQALSILNSCKLIEDKVNALSMRFKQEDKCHLLTGQDIQILHELAENLRLRLGVLREKLDKIYDKELLGDEVIGILFSEVPGKFQYLHNRLTKGSGVEDGDDPIWPIIYQKVFEASDFEDDEEAIEILAEWSIVNPKDYRESGLFGNLTDDEYKSLTDKHVSTRLYKLGVDNLAFLNIKHISDWKRLEIFNANMLKNYLAQEKHALALKARSLTLLEE